MKLIAILWFLFLFDYSAFSQDNFQVTNCIRFNADGSGQLSIWVTADRYEDIVQFLGFPITAKPQEIESALGLAITNLGMREISKKTTVGVSSCSLKYTCAFPRPESVLQWFDDDVFVHGKDLKWSDQNTTMHLRLHEHYTQDIVIRFVFVDRTITSANEILINAPAISWRPNGPNSSLTLNATK